jgi:hypothetical protein
MVERLTLFNVMAGLDPAMTLKSVNLHHLEYQPAE